MKRLALKVLAILALMIVTFFAAGYVLPYGARVTVVNASTVRLERGAGFYKTLTYRIDRSTGNETLVIAGFTGATRVEYDGTCKCVADYDIQYNVGDKPSFFVSRRHERDGMDFYVTDVFQKDGPLKGEYVKLGFWRPVEDMKPFFDEAQALLDGVRKRFADVIPKS
jgi:hypothetical protein